MNTHQRFLQKMNEMQKAVETATGKTLDLPPKCLTELRGEFLVWEPGRRLMAQFPFDHRFTNPTGALQGGLLCTVLDNVWGPLSYEATGAACVTLELSCNFIRPFLAGAEDVQPFMKADGYIVEQTKSLLFMEGRVYNPQGKLLATGKTTSMILR